MNSRHRAAGWRCVATGHFSHTESQSGNSRGVCRLTPRFVYLARCPCHLHKPQQLITVSLYRCSSFKGLQQDDRTRDSAPCARGPGPSSRLAPWCGPPNPQGAHLMTHKRHFSARSGHLRDARGGLRPPRGSQAVLYCALRCCAHGVLCASGWLPFSETGLVVVNLGSTRALRQAC